MLLYELVNKFLGENITFYIDTRYILHVYVTVAIAKKFLL